jgi:hypothetical protein
MDVNGARVVKLSELLRLCYKLQNKLFVNVNNFRCFFRKISFQVIFLFKEALIHFASVHLRDFDITDSSRLTQISYELPTRRKTKCWKTEKMMGGQFLRWNKLMKDYAYVELDSDDDLCKFTVHSACPNTTNKNTRVCATAVVIMVTMLGGFLVTTAWRVLRLRMKGTASIQT